MSKGNTPDLAALAEEVHRTKRPRVLRRADEDLAVVMPVFEPAPHRQRGRALTKEDGLWQIVGIGHSTQPTDIAHEKDRYLAETYLAETRQE